MKRLLIAVLVVAGGVCISSCTRSNDTCVAHCSNAGGGGQDYKLDKGECANVTLTKNIELANKYGYDTCITAME
ncbi:MAG: hypothetical protein JWQ38_2038 [Flavipsychrobacter sp.]|nr:hypothetical protein [Flavipsychrobacter sp.]